MWGQALYIYIGLYRPCNSLWIWTYIVEDEGIRVDTGREIILYACLLSTDELCHSYDKRRILDHHHLTETLRNLAMSEWTESLRWEYVDSGTQRCGAMVQFRPLYKEGWFNVTSLNRDHLHIVSLTSTQDIWYRSTRWLVFCIQLRLHLPGKLLSIGPDGVVRDGPSL